MPNKLDKLQAFIIYLNKDKISNVVGIIWIVGFIFTIFDKFYFQSRFQLFTLCFYYYIIPILLFITIVWVVILFKRFKKTS